MPAMPLRSKQPLDIVPGPKSERLTFPNPDQAKGIRPKVMLEACGKNLSRTKKLVFSTPHPALGEFLYYGPRHLGGTFRPLHTDCSIHRIANLRTKRNARSADDSYCRVMASSWHMP